MFLISNKALRSLAHRHGLPAISHSSHKNSHYDTAAARYRTRLTTVARALLQRAAHSIPPPSWASSGGCTLVGFASRSRPQVQSRRPRVVCGALLPHDNNNNIVYSAVFKQVLNYPNGSFPPGEKKADLGGDFDAAVLAINPPPPNVIV